MELNGPAFRPAFDEEHYLRRGNEHVRVTKVRRSAARAALRIGLWLGAAGAVTGIGFALVHHVTHAPAFAVQHLVVEGCTRTDAQALKNRLDSALGKNLILLRPATALPDLAGLPWVERPDRQETS